MREVRAPGTTDHLTATHYDGDVIITTDPATARDLANAWGLLNAAKARSSELPDWLAAELALLDDRPRWYDALVELHTAAAYAGLQRGDVAPPLNVRLLPGGAK